MNLYDEHFSFRPKREGSSPARMLIWGVLIILALWFFTQLQNGSIQPVSLVTPAPTRTAASFAGEGQALFAAGDIDGAVRAFEDAIASEPQNARVMADLAQLQIYSSTTLTTDEERHVRLNQALDWIILANELAPRDSYVQAIRAFVYDWNSDSTLIDATTRENYLFVAESAATLAVQLDSSNLLAQVYYAEVLLDQSKWSQAQSQIEAVLTANPQFMDAYRVHGNILETLGLYREAIEAYEKAAEFAPNLTFLYLRIGYNFRTLNVYNRALEFFDKAANINKLNGIEDPTPYIAIAKTYAQQGEFFIAARNAERALEFNPTDANTYGQLGIIYTQARNYESAMFVLKCATYGCTAEENDAAINVMGEGVAVNGLPMTSLQVAFYYLQYGSVLAGLNQCDLAHPVLDDVEAGFGDNPVVAEIIAENREICRLLGLGE